MALAVSLRFDFQDDKGKTSFTKVRVPATGFELSHYSECAAGIAQTMAAISTARITRVSLTIALDLTSAVIKAVASGLADIAQKAIAGFSTVIAGLRTKFKLPAISETKVVSGSDAIDTADADVAALLTAMENGIVVTGTTVEPGDSRSNVIQSTDYIREYFRRT